MTYGWARDFALELINQYSIAGANVPESYNNQADYVKRIPKLVDDAQFLLATNEGRMRELVSLSGLEKEKRGEWEICVMPEDFWHMAGGLVLMDETGISRFCGHRLVGGNRLAVPRALAGKLQLEYYRLPRPVGTDPMDDAELDNTVAAQMAVPYYVAAHLVMYDNEFAYAALLNEFEQKRALLRETPRAEWGLVEDVYEG